MSVLHVLELVCASVVAANFEVGVGIADITGPSVQVTFAGFAISDQTGTGILQRTRARAFVWRNPEDKKLIAFASLDACFSANGVTDAIIANLGKIFPGKFTHENVIISWTHSHSGPGGYQSEIFDQITSLFFVDQTFTALVNGTTLAIERAYSKLAPATTHLAMGSLDKANINRSPLAYERNKDVAKYNQAGGPGNTDKRFLQLNIVSNETGQPSGIINWFAVHGNTLNSRNTLVSGDNRGYASYQVERQFNGVDKPAGQGPFVAAFASSNLGDVSPNTAGPRCRTGLFAGTKCDPNHATCGGDPRPCWAVGPGKDMYDSCAIIGSKQSAKALDLMNATEVPQIPLTGKLDYRHSFVRMPELKINGGKQQLCYPALGFSLFAGGTDGPTTVAWFEQGDKEGALKPLLSDWIGASVATSTPSQKQIECQSPKPIFLNFDKNMTHPYPWLPEVLPIQIARLGCLFILAVPGEFTTMSGRRLRDGVEKELAKHLTALKCNKVYTTIAGLSNSYGGYIATPEEYGAQWYEGASTYYGPNTLLGYIQEFVRLAKDLATGTTSATEPAPKSTPVDEMIRLIPDPKLDKCPDGGTACFGDVTTPLSKSVFAYGEKVEVSFQGANPRHNLRLEGSYLTLERVLGDRKTEVVMTDSDWATRFEWRSKQQTQMKGNTADKCGSLLPDGLKLLDSGYKLLSQGITRSEKLGEIAVKYANLSQFRREFDIKQRLCLSAAEATASTTTLSVTLPAEKDDLYSLTKGQLKLCYHGDYKVQENKTVYFKNCSGLFTVTAKNQVSEPSTTTPKVSEADQWSLLMTTAIISSVFLY